MKTARLINSKRLKFFKNGRTEKKFTAQREINLQRFKDTHA